MQSPIMAAHTSGTSRSKITLKGTQETLFITLYGRYVDALSEDPILGDKWVGPILEQVDYDFSKLGIGQGTSNSIATRGRLFDRWTRDFLALHPMATVIHMACGLDTRAHRLEWGEGVRWIDVDLPDVVELRRKLIPEPEGNRDYTLLAGSAIDPEFIKSLPNDRPTIIVIEGLTIYLEPEDGEMMVATMCTHFKTGEMMMDGVNWLVLATQRFFAYVRNTSSTLRWAINPEELENKHAPLKLLEAPALYTLDTMSRYPGGARFFMWLMSLFPATRNTIRYLHYGFGSAAGSE